MVNKVDLQNCVSHFNLKTLDAQFHAGKKKKYGRNCEQHRLTELSAKLSKKFTVFVL